MRTIIGVWIVLAVVGLAQQRPDFSGRWLEISPRQSSDPMIVRQDATTLSMRHGSEGGGEHAFTYRLDGVETRNPLSLHSHDKSLSVAKAEWVGSTLRITSSTTYSDGRKMNSVQDWSLNAGGRLVVEMTETTSGKSVKQTVVFRKAD